MEDEEEGEEQVSECGIGTHRHIPHTHIVCTSLDTFFYFLNGMNNSFRLDPRPEPGPALESL